MWLWRLGTGSLCSWICLLVVGKTAVFLLYVIRLWAPSRHQLCGDNMGALVCPLQETLWEHTFISEIISPNWLWSLTSTFSFLLLDTERGRKMKFLVRPQTSQCKEESSLLDFLPSPTPIPPNHKAVSKPCPSFNNICPSLCCYFILSVFVKILKFILVQTIQS